MPSERRLSKTEIRVVWSSSRIIRRFVFSVLAALMITYIVLFVVLVSANIDVSTSRELQQRAMAALEEPQRFHSIRSDDSGAWGAGMLFSGRAAMARLLWKNSGTLAVFPRSKRLRNIFFCTIPRFQNPPGPLIALASFPGSGNTWIRYLVQQATGYLTGSIYKDFSLMKNGFPAESINNGSVIFVKTHEWGAPVRQQYQKAVLVVRDPYDALLAEFNRRAGGHLGHASRDRFTKDKVWRKFVEISIRNWMHTIVDWLKFQGPIQVLHYEDMVNRLPEELIRLTKFLNVTVTRQTLSCTLRNRDGIFKRRKKLVDFDPFDQSMKETIEKYKEIVNRALRIHAQGLQVGLEQLSLKTPAGTTETKDIFTKLEHSVYV
ncbi:WSCD family member CG9164-like [Tachypleus tridentatus]|uniref:WSCD family member CG9164-like n=1 Tax=Tachypleus tridentatus TaxID=6853 RepID=UPI003FD5C0A6